MRMFCIAGATWVRRWWMKYEQRAEDPSRYAPVAVAAVGDRVPERKDEDRGRCGPEGCGYEQQDDGGEVQPRAGAPPR